MTLQPGDFGTNLNQWFRLLGREWKPLLITSLVAYTPLAVVVAVLYLVADVGGILTQLSKLDVTTVTLQELLDIVGPAFAASVIAIVAQVLATAFVYLAAARITARHLAGIESDWREPSRFAWGRMGRAVAASLLVVGVSSAAVALVASLSWALIANLGTTFVAIFLTSVLVLTSLVVLIWLSLSVSLYAQSIALTPRGPLDSIKESFRLVQGRWWITAGYLVVTSLIASLILQVMNFALVPLYVVGTAIPAALVVVAALTTLIQAPVVAAMAAAYAIWYVDLRAREENLEADSIVV